MACVFFGHRDTPISIREEIRKIILELIENGVCDFYVGNNGGFDLLVQGVFSQISKEQTKINFYIVLSCINEHAISGSQELSVFPDQLACVPRRFAISKRNEYLLKKASIIVAYAKQRISNTDKIIERAIKKGIKIINLA